MSKSSTTRQNKLETPRRIAEMLRVDHAGEYAAVAIYRGQQAVFGRHPKTRDISDQLKQMEAEEQKHLEAFDRLLVERDVRPTAMAPIWNIAGYGLSKNSPSQERSQNSQILLLNFGKTNYTTATLLSKAAPKTHPLTAFYLR